MLSRQIGLVSKEGKIDRKALKNDMDGLEKKVDNLVEDKHKAARVEILALLKKKNRYINLISHRRIRP